MRENLTEKKREDAMRIFEALSCVDEELLVRCEEASGKSAGRKRRAVWYYGSAVAACLCLLVCGAVLLNERSFLSQNKTSGTDCAVSLDGVEQEMAADAGVAEPREHAAGSVGCASETAENQEDILEAAVENGTIEAAMKEQNGQKEDAATEGKNSAEEAAQQMISDKKSGSALTESCLPYDGEQITLQEAQNVEILGVYVPNVLPAGYTFESAYREKSADTGEVVSLSLCWTRGMDSIFWTISKAAADTSTVDISKPETYDVHLYEIPYANTVPEAYRDSFDNPVFAEADFSLDMVKSRMKVIMDAGDTDTSRGNFSVLYENGILVRFNGRGDAESIYAMFP